MDDGRMTEASHTISFPGAFGSGELKITIRFALAFNAISLPYMVTDEALLAETT